MSTFDTRDEDEQARIARQQFETLQASVVSRRRAIPILRANAVIGIQRWRQERIKLSKDEAELKRLHKLLHPDEQ